MMSVNQYVDAFTNYLRSGDPSGVALFCENTAHLKRLAVYRNGFYKSCIDALAANFPSCQKSLGGENFRKIAQLYIDHFPPKQGTLVGYGQNFPIFLADFISDNSSGTSAFANTFSAQDKIKQAVEKFSVNLVDIAHLDYAWLMSLMSADSDKILTTEYVTKLAESGHDITLLSVKLNPSVLLLRVNEGAFNEWVSLKTDSSKTLKNQTSDFDFILLWRLQGAVQARSLFGSELALMQSLQRKGKSLGEAFDAALAIDENFAVSDVFSACLQNQLIETEMI